MSLIPYQAKEGREIVLRHQNAIVVRDATSHRLEIRGPAECPTCHQALRTAPPEHSFGHSYDATPDSYVDPGYFRMLRAGNSDSSSDNQPSSPIRRLFKPALANGSPRAQTVSSDITEEDAEFISSTPGLTHAEGSRIRREAFSPNYFKTFFSEEKILGKGGKGVVLLVRHEIDGCHLGHFACKRVPVGDDHAWLEKVLVEVELLAKLSHPNLVSYRHVWLEDVRLTMFGPSVACAFILQQYCNGGDLHQHVVGSVPREVSKEELKEQMRRRSRGQAETSRFEGKAQLPFEEIYSLFKDITSGVAYLHGANYIHRDLKPSNCLLHREGGKLTCLISDFGEVEAENVARKSTGATGTISYCAPEVLRADVTGKYGNFTTKSDVFSLGMILYFMCFNTLPYQGANAIQEELEDIEQLRAEITDWKGFQDERRERPDLPSKLYKLLKKLLSLDPAERPSASEVLHAMKNETNIDGITRAERSASPSVGLRGSRVQSLDSPFAPGTPVPDSRQNLQSSRSTVTQNETGSWPMSVTPDEAPSGNGKLPLQYSPPSSHAMVETRSRDRFRKLSNTSLHDQPLLNGNGNGNGNGHVRPGPPLLMAPPRRGSQELRYRFALALVQLRNSAGLSQDLLGYIGRLTIFLVKITTLIQPCWPYVASLEVSIPLVVVAALDLGLPASSSSRQTRQLGAPSFIRHFRTAGVGMRLLLLASHLAVVWMAKRWSALCVIGRQDEWTDW